MTTEREPLVDRVRRAFDVSDRAGDYVIRKAQPEDGINRVRAELSSEFGALRHALLEIAADIDLLFADRENEGH